MAHYRIEELISMWEREKLSPEQIIGQILLFLVTIEKRLKKLEARQPPDQR